MKKYCWVQIKFKRISEIILLKKIKREKKVPKLPKLKKSNFYRFADK